MGSQVLQLIATGLSTGVVYALLGLALTVTYSTTRVVNVAVGEFAMVGALVAASLVAAGWPLWLASLLGVLCGVISGILMYLLTIRPAQARGATPLTLLIITIAVHLFAVGVGLIIWGTGAYELPAFIEGPPVPLLSAFVRRQAIFGFLVAAVILAVLYLLFTRTVTGKALLACAANARGARLMGIPVARMGMLAFAISAGIGAVAGILVTPGSFAIYNMGLLLGLKGFVGAIIGKLQNYVMTVVGCLGLGLVESLVSGLISSGYRDAVAFVVLIGVLLWRAIPALRSGVLTAEEAE